MEDLEQRETTVTDKQGKADARTTQAQSYGGYAKLVA